MLERFGIGVSCVSFSISIFIYQHIYINIYIHYAVLGIISIKLRFQMDGKALMASIFAIISSCCFRIIYSK